MRKRVGRGIGSGLGKTAGRGGKGQTARSGGAKAGFEGGQMPIYRRLPKRGFNKPNALSFNEINLGRLQAAIDAGQLDAGKPVDATALLAAGLTGKPRDGVRLLGKGVLTAKIAITSTMPAEAPPRRWRRLAAPSRSLRRSNPPRGATRRPGRPQAETVASSGSAPDIFGSRPPEGMR